MSILSTIEKLLTKREAAKNSAHQAYDSLVSRAASDQKDHGDTPKFIDKIVTNAGQSLEQFRSDVANEKKRAELSEIASGADRWQLELGKLKDKKKALEAQRDQKLQDIKDEFAGLVRGVQLDIKNALQGLSAAESSRQQLGIDQREEMARLQAQLREAQEQAAHYSKRTIGRMREAIREAIDASNKEVNHQRDSKRTNKDYHRSLELQKDLEEALKIIELPKLLQGQIQRLERLSK